MGPSYAGLTAFLPPMSQVSIDILGHIEVLCFTGSYQTHKIYPLVEGDLNFKAINIEFLEGASGMDVAYGFLALQGKYYPLILVVSDAGTSLQESVVNLKTKDGTLMFDNALFHAPE